MVPSHDQSSLIFTPFKNSADVIPLIDGKKKLDLLSILDNDIVLDEELTSDDDLLFFSHNADVLSEKSHTSHCVSEIGSSGSGTGSIFSARNGLAFFTDNDRFDTTHENSFALFENNDPLIAQEDDFLHSASSPSPEDPTMFQVFDSTENFSASPSVFQNENESDSVNNIVSDMFNPSTTHVLKSSVSPMVITNDSISALTTDRRINLKQPQVLDYAIQEEIDDHEIDDQEDDAADEETTTILPKPVYKHSQSRQNVSTILPKLKYKCKVCHKKFKRPSSLSTHMNIHTGNKPYFCPAPNCSKSFNAKSNMLRHYKLHFRLSNGVYLLPNGEMTTKKPTSKQLFPLLMEDSL